MPIGDERDEVSDAEALRRALQRQHLEQRYRDLSSFVPFVGYSRSGGSVVAALLDAHPEMVVAHQYDVFERDDQQELTGSLRHADPFELLERIVMQAAVNAQDGRTGERLRVDGTRYHSSYAVPGTEQGRYSTIRIVGTKNSVETADVLLAYGGAPLRRLQEGLGVPVRLVHVIRNPFDNIATMARLHGDRAIVRYFKRSRGVLVAKEEGWPVIDVHLEVLIDRPEVELTRLCRFLDVTPSPTYLEACAAIVSSTPNETRDTHEWTCSEVRAVRAEMERFPWLTDYAGTEVPCS